MDQIRIIRLITKVVISIVVSVFFLYFGSYAMYKTINNLLTMKEGPKFYCYYNQNDSNEVYGISSLQATRWSKKIDAMLSYYKYKFLKMPYEYSDMSFIRKLPNNTIVTVQEYYRDSNIVLVAYPEFNTIRKRVMTTKLYVPAYILHVKPFQITNKD